MSLQPTAARTSRDVTGWLAFLVLFAALLAQQIWFGNTFPIPWNDETAFIAQSFELAYNGRLFVWGLNQHDTVMWMPPGYMMFLAFVYKIVGYDYTLSRLTSMVFYLATYAVLWRVARAHLSGWHYSLSIALILAFHLSLKALASANIARMDALMVLLIVIATLQFARHRHVLGLSIILGSALVHFNAVYGLILPAAVLMHSILWRNALIVRPHELLAVALALTALGLYALYVSRHFDTFLHDMKFQFDFKAVTSQFMGGEQGIRILAVLLALPVLILMTSRHFKPSVAYILGGVALVALALHGGNMWYRSAFATGLGLCTIGLMMEWQSIRLRMVGVLFLMLLLFQVHTGWNRLGYINGTLEFMERNVFTPGRVFLSEEDIERVRTALRAMPEGSRVSFGYSGIEPFFFDTLHEENLRWTIPGHSVTQVFPAREIDYRVFCDSSLFPPGLFQFDWDGFPRQGKDSGCVVHDLATTRTHR